MAVQRVDKIDVFICLSGDVKPAVALVGSALHETDTGLTFVFDGSSWLPDLRLYKATFDAIEAAE